MTPVLAFPINLPLIAIELDDHDDVSYGDDDEDEGPEELADPRPDVGPLFGQIAHQYRAEVMFIPLRLRERIC